MISARRTIGGSVAPGFPVESCHSQCYRDDLAGRHARLPEPHLRHGVVSARTTAMRGTDAHRSMVGSGRAETVRAELSAVDP